MLTSCSPAGSNSSSRITRTSWKSLDLQESQQMLGALIKSFVAEREHLEPANIFSVAIMPAGEEVRSRAPRNGRDGVADVDAC